MSFIGYAVSVKGASHEESGTPCQDSARVHITKDVAIAAVSDGHGSEKHFRSDAGSDMATRVAIRSLMDFTERNGGLDKMFRDNPENAARRIAGNIIYSWNGEIDAHMLYTPFTDAEHAISRKHGGIPVESVYGATLIVAAVTGRGLFGLQIGDGSFAAQERGAMRFPMPEDDRLIGNLTTSLCDNDAIGSFRWFYQAGTFQSVILSTDGLINSFRSSEDFLHFGERLTAAVSSKKTHELAEHLAERSKGGSRDDISVAVLTKK
ncbi:MAG: protein phosphatase 2C domain-containing protein [Ruminococcaceae bacterium]|nr:protein phosphatase 2C domain-containing protein [Oscillospiraceae bacterium]